MQRRLGYKNFYSEKLKKITFFNQITKLPMVPNHFFLYLKTRGDFQFLRMLSQGNAGIRVRNLILKSVKEHEQRAEERDRDTSQILDQILTRNNPQSIDELFPLLTRVFTERSQPSGKLHAQNIYLEFHQLLCLCLMGYRNSLKILSSLRNNSNPPDPQILTTELKCGISYLIVLSTMAYTDAVEAYFAMLAPEMVIHAEGRNVEDAEDAGGDEEDEEEDEEAEDEEDPVIFDMRPSAKVVFPFKRHLNWLRLQTIYQCAIDRITHLAQRIPGKAPIQIKVIYFYTPRPTTCMKPWRDVVNDVMPSTCSPDMLPGSEDACESDNLYQHATEVLDIIHYGFPKLEAALDRRFLNTRGFPGSPHCEIILATLMLLTPEKLSQSGDMFKFSFDEIIDIDRTAVGVSKRCCPICTKILRLLVKHKDWPKIGPRNIYVSGSHRTYKGCTLPALLPSGVVDQILETLEGQLRRYLCTLKQSRQKDNDDELYHFDIRFDRFDQ